MPQRRRTSHLPAHVPLTYQRLAVHSRLAENQPRSITDSLSMPISSSTSPALAPTPATSSLRSVSPSRLSEFKVRDIESKLCYYGIYFCQRRALPDGLQVFVDELRAGAGSSMDSVRSPNARQVVQRHLQAHRLDKQDGIDLLMDVLLFSESDHLPMLAVKAKQTLDERYLPPPMDLAWVEEYGALDGPPTDHLFGYRHWKDSDSNTTAFSALQEFGLLSRAVAPALHFPFLWKSPKTNETHFQARPEGARCGAIIVRHSHQFYTEAGIVPNAKETAHFSLTIDMESAHLFVHWQEFDQDCPSYYMEPIMKAFLDHEQQVASMRNTLKQILTYAMGSRLARLRDVVQATQTQ